MLLVLEQARVLVHAVELDHGVVERVAHDGEERGHDVRAHGDLEPRVDAERHHEVVEKGDDGAEGHLELVADGDVDDDGEDGHAEGRERRARDVGAPVGADGRDGEAVCGEPQGVGHGLGVDVRRRGVGRLGADEEAVDAVGLGGLDGGRAFAGGLEGAAHLLDRDVARRAEVYLGAARELDAPDEPAGKKPHERKDDEDGGNGEERLAMPHEGDLVREVATHAPRPPSWKRHGFGQAPRERRPAQRPSLRPCAQRPRRGRA